MTPRDIRQSTAGTPVSEIDVAGTRAERLALHEQVRLRAHLLTLLTTAPLDEELVWVTPGEVSSDTAEWRDLAS